MENTEHEVLGLRMVRNDHHFDRAGQRKTTIAPDLFIGEYPPLGRCGYMVVYIRIWFVTITHTQHLDARDHATNN